MSRSRWRLALLVLVVEGLFSTVALANPQRAVVPPPEVVREAVRLGHEGRELFGQERLSDAYAKFSAAEQLAHSPVFTLYMARSLRRMGRLLEARPLFESTASEALPESSPPAWHAARAEASSELESLRRAIPRLTFEVSGASRSDVQISVGATLLSGRSWATEIDPGRHVVVASVDDRRVERVVSVAEGERVRVRLDFAVRSPRPGGGGVVPPPRVESAEAGASVWMWTSFGVASAAAVGGAVTFGVAWQKKQALQCDDSGDCEKGSEDDKQELSNLADWATAGFVVAGVAAAAGVTIWLVSGEEPDETNTATRRASRVALSAGPTGVTLAGSF